MNLAWIHKQLCTKQLHSMRVISDAAGQCHHIYPQFLPGTDRDVQGPWLAPSNAIAFQLHIKYTRGNQPSQQHNAECCHTQKGLFQFANALKNIKMQFIWSHNIPAAKQCVSAALAYENVPDTRKQTLKVECCPLEHGYSIPCSFSTEK